MMLIAMTQMLFLMKSESLQCKSTDIISGMSHYLNRC